MTAHLWPSAWAEPPRITPAPATPPAGLPHLEDVRPTYRDDRPSPGPHVGASSTATQPRPYLATLDGQPRTRRRDPLPRELAHPAGPRPPAPLGAREVRDGLAAIAAATPDAATRLGHARGVAHRMHHELEAHGMRALGVVQDPTATAPARADADAQLAAWRTGLHAIEAILAAIAGAPSEVCDLPPDLRAP